MAALWPERCKAMVSVSGYLIGNQEAGKIPLPPKAELQWWYQYYFATERGHIGYEKNRKDLQSSSGNLLHRNGILMIQHLTIVQYRSTILIMSSIVIHNYRWRLGLPKVSSNMMNWKCNCQRSCDPCTCYYFEGDANGAPHPDAASMQRNLPASIAPYLLTVVSDTIFRRKRQRNLPMPSLKWIVIKRNKHKLPGRNWPGKTKLSSHF